MKYKKIKTIDEKDIIEKLLKNSGVIIKEEITRINLYKEKEGKEVNDKTPEWAKQLIEDMQAIKNTPTMRAELEGKEYEPSWVKNLINRFDRLEVKVDNVDRRLANVEKDIKKMKNTPTMKAELQGKEYEPSWVKNIIKSNEKRTMFNLWLQGSINWSKGKIEKWKKKEANANRAI